MLESEEFKEVILISDTFIQLEELIQRNKLEIVNSIDLHLHGPADYFIDILYNKNIKSSKLKNWNIPISLHHIPKLIEIFLGSHPSSGLEI